MKKYNSFDDLEIGNPVKHKAGGPKMTISNIIEKHDNSGERIFLHEAEWFDEFSGMFKKQKFDRRNLILLDD